MEPILSIATDKLVPALVDTAVGHYKTWAEEYAAYLDSGSQRATRALTRSAATLEGSVAVLRTMWSLFEVDYDEETVRNIIRQQYETKYNINN